jgi:hypothetical protein
MEEGMVNTKNVIVDQTTLAGLFVALILKNVHVLRNFCFKMLYQSHMITAC